ncbi:MAG: hypothetical protein R3C14_22485 [Caldilineaceae bacterium]
MTILVTISDKSQAEKWEYWYSEKYNMISLERLASALPHHTLQGAYNLIIKADTFNIISYFETVTLAEITYWTVVPTLKAPAATWAQLIVEQDLDDGQPQAYFTNTDYTVFYTRLGEPKECANLRCVAIGEQVIVDVTYDGALVGVWMVDLPPEIGRKHAKQL